MNPLSKFKFRLYVAGDTRNSMQALANLKRFCQTYLADGHEIEIFDVFKEPCQALEDGIFMTPTLVKLSPSPMIRIVGTLNQTEVLVQAFGLDVLIV
jgi:circadian clock protein KaiB